MTFKPSFSSSRSWWCTGGLFLIIGSPMLALAFCFSPTVVVQPSFLGKERRHLSSDCTRLRMTGATSTSSLEDIDMGDDLTKYELGLRLKEVRDYYLETDEMSQENVCLSLFRTRLPKLRLNRCFVGAESTIAGAGRGLFASRDIEEGELITLYPGDIMLAWETTVGDFSGEVGVLFGNHVQKEDQQSTADRLTTDSARAYELTIGGRHSVVGDSLLADDTAYLGHIANDSAMLSSKDKVSVNNYLKASEKGHNAAYFVLEGSHFVNVATKNIAKGQEIFVSYGYNYWFSRSNQEQIDTSTQTKVGIAGTAQKSPSGSSSTSSKTDRVAKKGMKKTTKKPGTKKGFGKT